MHKIDTNYQPQQFDTNLFTQKKCYYPWGKKHVSVLNNIAVHHANSRKRCKVSYKRSSSTMKMQSDAQNTQQKPSSKITLTSTTDMHCGWLYWTQVRSLSLAERSFHIEHFEHWLGLSLSLSFIESWLTTAVKVTKDVNWIHALTLSTADKSRKSCQ